MARQGVRHPAYSGSRLYCGVVTDLPGPACLQQARLRQQPVTRTVDLRNWKPCQKAGFRQCLVVGPSRGLAVMPSSEARGGLASERLHPPCETAEPRLQLQRLKRVRCRAPHPTGQSSAHMVEDILHLVGTTPRAKLVPAYAAGRSQHTRTSRPVLGSQDGLAPPPSQPSGARPWRHCCMLVQLRPAARPRAAPCQVLCQCGRTIRSNRVALGAESGGSQRADNGTREASCAHFAPVWVSPRRF